MTNTELEQKRIALADKRRKITGLHPMMAAGDIKAAAELAAEITDELTRRELLRDQLVGEVPA